MSTSHFDLFKATVHSHHLDGTVSVQIPALAGTGTIHMPSVPSGLTVPGPGESVMIATNGDRSVFEWVLGPITLSEAAALEAHIVDLTPHPGYDDLPSLTILFENGIT